MITEIDVRAVLNSIIDPCSAAAGAPAGLQDMGLVREIVIAPGQGDRTDVKVVIAVTEFGCLMGAPFVHEALERLALLEKIGEVDIRLDDRFDWLPSDMDPDYRARLQAGRDQRGRIPIRVHHSR